MQNLKHFFSTVLLLLGGADFSVAQTAPADPNLDWLMAQAKPTPTTQDAVTPAPPSPLVSSGAKNDGRQATLELSDGSTLAGTVTTTPGRPLRMWDEEKKEYLDLPFSRVKSIAAEVVWERDEREWQFKQAGADEKVYSGKTYPARELAYTLTLNDGKTIRGGIVAPVELTDEKSGEATLFVLHKRDKGTPGQTSKELVYVKQINFHAQQQH